MTCMIAASAGLADSWLNKRAPRGGRGLAPDSGASVNDDVDCATAIGGKPPPTLGSVVLNRLRCSALVSTMSRFEAFLEGLAG
jgi:hypothetical protein